MVSVQARIAEELGVKEQQVQAAVDLLDGGATVPFVARYRKEATGSLDDAQLRTLEERLRYLRELEARRKVILDSVREQGKLDATLEAAIMAADSKGRLEDIYLPYKPKRRTKAEIAREAGLRAARGRAAEGAARVPAVSAEPYVSADRNVADVAAALDGARAILVERFAENADLIGACARNSGRTAGSLPRVREGKNEAGAKFSDYFDFSEALAKMPSHRVLALFRGEREEILDLAMEPDDPATRPAVSAPVASAYELRIMRAYGIADQGRPGDKWLADTVRWAWRTKIMIMLSIDLRLRLWTAAEEEAVRVFASNLRDLLLAAPAGARPTLGLDPGFRTGVKVAVVDATGKVVATSTIYPHEPQRRWDEALAVLAKLVREHKVELIAIGNGTASRETDKLAIELLKGLGGAQAAEDRGVGGRRVGLFGLGLCVGGAARPRRDAARRGVDRAPAAGSARGTGEDRSEVDRRRPVPARSQRIQAVAIARRGGRGLRQRRRRRPEHGVGAAAGARLGHRRRRWPRASSPIATRTARSAPARRSRTCRGSAPRRSSSAPASCASPAATIRSTLRPCIPNPIRWCTASSQRPGARSTP